MSWRWLGLLLLLISLIIGLIIAGDVKILQKVESWAVTDTGEELDGSYPVLVPPWNASEWDPPEGWVGFNVTLHHRDKEGYEVKGRILPADLDRQPSMVMYVVNETGLFYLIWDNFDPSTWNITKIYAAGLLDGSKGWLHADFRFRDIDTGKYVFLFRGLKNDTQTRPVAIFLKETWVEAKTLLQPTTTNISLVATTGVIGLVLVARKPRSKRKTKAKLRKT